MSVDDELILSKWLQVSWCSCLAKEQLWLDNEQKVIEQKHYYVLSSTNLRVTKSISLFLSLDSP